MQIVRRVTEGLADAVHDSVESLFEIAKRLCGPDLRHNCDRLCHSAGGELEQIQFLLGNRSVETTERYLGSPQRIVDAVNDKPGIEPEAPPG